MTLKETTKLRIQARVILILFFIVFAKQYQCVQCSNIKNPEKANEYSSDFFAGHAKNKDSYVDFALVVSKTINKAMKMNNLIKDKSISLLTVGCGHGLSVESLRASGFSNSYCIEGSPSAEKMWPKKYRDFYAIQDVTKITRKKFLQIFPGDVPSSSKKFDIVLSFEVAEHLPENFSSNFIALLTVHKPTLIFFTAATPFQDMGQNPSHINENTFEYWINKFRKHNYIVDWAMTAQVRHKLVNQLSHYKVWWYGKNMFIFTPKKYEERIENALNAFQANMLDDSYLTYLDSSQVGPLWKRDWAEFGTLFHSAQDKAKKKIKRQKKNVSNGNSNHQKDLKKNISVSNENNDFDIDKRKDLTERRERHQSLLQDKMNELPSEIAPVKETTPNALMFQGLVLSDEKRLEICLKR